MKILVPLDGSEYGRKVVGFLASDAARFVHGETVEVNGGILCD